MSTNPALAPVLLAPHGLHQIVTTFGDIFAHIRADRTLDPGWETEALTRVPLPFAMNLSWDKSRGVTKFTCHRLLAQKFTEAFAQIHAEGLQSAITTFGGCFAFRQQRTGSKLSAHAWGIAIDLNPASNAQGTAGDMDHRVVTIFLNAGFSWGGDWKGRTRDPMHFQFCTGY